MAVSARLAMVGFQKAAQAFDAEDLAIVPSIPRLNDLIDALMGPFMMVVLKILGQDVT